MKAKCLTSFFSQNISGTVGEVITVKDAETMQSLVDAGYVEEMQHASAESEDNTAKKTSMKKER